MWRELPLSTAQIRYDPFDADIHADPYPTYRLLRDEASVYRATDSNTWVLSRHRDVIAACLTTTAIRRSTASSRLRQEPGLWSRCCP